jgi:hypothetical protein
VVFCDPYKMLVVDAGCSTSGSASPSLLDSPTLARVERARLRQEGSASAGGVGVGGSSPLHHAACCQVFSAQIPTLRMDLPVFERHAMQVMYSCIRLYKCCHPHDSLQNSGVLCFVFRVFAMQVPAREPAVRGFSKFSTAVHSYILTDSLIMITALFIVDTTKSLGVAFDLVSAVVK